MQRRVALVVAVLVACASVHGAGAQNAADEFRRRTLVGLRGVGVLIESIDSEIEKAGLSVSILRTDVELELRRSGITVLPSIAELSPPAVLERMAAGDPYLYVNVNALRSPAGYYVYSVHVELQQGARLVRDPKMTVHAATWNSGSAGTVGLAGLSMLRERVRDHVDRFANDYLAANPKR